MRLQSFGLCIFFALTLTGTVRADNLYNPGGFAGLISDNKARHVGDILTVIVYQNAEARNSASKSRSKESEVSGGWRMTGVEEFGTARLGSDYTGRGEVRRSESFLTSVSVSVVGVPDDGTLLVEGHQRLFINGEATDVTLRGRVRSVDITPENTILSTRLADAEINYTGDGFVSRSTNPGLLNWLYGILGLLG